MTMERREWHTLTVRAGHRFTSPESLIFASCSFPSIPFQVLHEPRILLSKVHPSHIKHKNVCHQNTRNTTNRSYDECPSDQCKPLLIWHFNSDMYLPLTEIGLNRSEYLCTYCSAGLADRC